MGLDRRSRDALTWIAALVVSLVALVALVA